MCVCNHKVFLSNNSPSIMAAEAPGAANANFLPVDQNQQKLNDFFGGDLKGISLNHSTKIPYTFNHNVNNK